MAAAAAKYDQCNNGILEALALPFTLNFCATDELARCVLTSKAFGEAVLRGPSLLFSIISFDNHPRDT